jgi:4-hydroxythreonine-4-phosphate dehydrogenase
MMPEDKPLVAVTMGDPAGIGPEICLRILADADVAQICKPIVYGSISLLERVSAECDLPLPPTGAMVDCGQLDAAVVKPGTVQPECGRAAADAIEAAVKDTLAGKSSAVVTAPINKEALNLAGVPYPGHTELLASLTNADEVCMMMASDEIIVSLATVHTGIANVSSELTSSKITTAINLTCAALQRLGKKTPSLTICGLNPHSGEQGLFGVEEETIIVPAVAQAREEGIIIDGPLSADTAFLPKRLDETDAYIVMYHDQGLIPFKMLAFGKGVNVTLGLPIVRTSVDHGTAFDIAWQGKASATSLVEAIKWASRLKDS